MAAACQEYSQLSYCIPVILVHVMARERLCICLSELYGGCWIAFEMDFEDIDIG